MAIFGALLLVFTIYVRPQEFIPALQSVGLLNIAVGLAVIGTGVELATGRIKSAWSPQLPWLAGFVGWCIICTLIKVGFSAVLDLKETLFFSTIFMIVVMYAGRTFSRFRLLAALLLALALGLSAIGLKQGQAEKECILLALDEDGEVAHDQSEGEPDGRACEEIPDCRKGGKGGNSEYVCEKPGPFNTFTVAGGRVRWRGTFADPNELSLAIGAALAFAFAFHASMRRWYRHLFLLATAAVVVWCIVLTGSRGGVLVALSIFAVYFVRRYGWKGLLAAGIAGAPVLLLGGRSGEDAEASSLERLGALYDGIDFFRQTPLFGLGAGQFVENYFITAHNSYLLAAAELGLPGMILWSMLVYVSIKICVVIAWRPPEGLDPRLPPYAMALATAFGGILVGIFFLSFCYKAMLFIYFGMAGALYGVAQASVPKFDLKIRGKEIAAVAAVDVAILSWLFVYTHLIKGAP